MNNLLQTLRNLENLKTKLSTEVAPGRQLYEDRERELLEYATELASEQTLNLLQEVKYAKEYKIESMKLKEALGEVSIAETKRVVEHLLLDKSIEYKTQEAILL